MWDERILSLKGKFVEVMIDYIDSNRARTYIPVKITSLKQGMTEAGKERCWFRVIDLETHRPKTLISSRVIAVCDRETGEIYGQGDDALNWIVEQLEASSPPFWPSERLLTVAVDIEFDDDGYVEDWFFGVSTAFRSALDIEIVEVKEKRTHPKTGEEYKVAVEKWARGVPPAYSFSARDNFKAPPLRGSFKRAKWGKQLEIITHTLTVTAAKPDKIEKRKIIEGSVSAELAFYVNGVLQETRQLEFTQSGFVEYLRHGPAVNPLV